MTTPAAPATMSTRGLYRDILRVRDARALISASAASQLGDWLYNAVLLGYVYTATGSAGWVGAATICRLLPYVLLGPVGGMIADRYDRRTVLLAGDLLRCALMLGLAAVVAVEGPVVLVIALTALASAAGSAERPAALALLPRLVGESRLGPANALLHTVQDLGVVVGPAIGAVLLVVAPDFVAFIVNAGTFAVSAALISTLRRRPSVAVAREGSGAAAQLRHGLRTARTSPYVMPLLVVLAMVEFTYGAQTVQLVLYAERELGFGAEGYGYLLAAAGVGGLLSAAINGRLAASTRVSGIVVITAGAVLRDADRVCGDRRHRGRAPRDAPRRCGLRGVRGGGRNGARPCRAGGRPRPRDGGGGRALGGGDDHRCRPRAGDHRVDLAHHEPDRPRLCDADRRRPVPGGPARARCAEP